MPRLLPLLALALASTVRASDMVPLLDPTNPVKGWAFNNGAEFPGATGSLTADAGTGRGEAPALKLVGDFTKGGGYVQAGRTIDGIDVRELTLRVRTPTTTRLTLRLNDATGQTHQIALRTEAQAEWQTISFPLERFFAARGRSDAVPGVQKYESWGGAKDGVWHGPAKAVYLLLGNPGDKAAHAVWFAAIDVTPKPVPVAGAGVTATVPLDEIADGDHDWRFTRGEEFKGAKGSLTVVKDEPAAGKTCLRLAGDFTGGGAYVGMVKGLRTADASDTTAVRLRVRTTNAAVLGVQMVDAAGQTHQRSRLPLKADGEWHDLELKPTDIAGGEHWGGPNDGKWRGPLARLSLMLSTAADPTGKTPTLDLADVRAEVVRPVFAAPPAFAADFAADKLTAGWAVKGDATADPKAGRRGGGLVLARTADDASKPTSATGPAFPVAPGRWLATAATRADLHSPDNSYSGTVTLEVSDAAGKVVERVAVVDTFGKRDWQTARKPVEFPAGAAAARFVVRLNKTYGRFVVDELSAAYLAPAPARDDRVSGLLFATARLGNLLLPDDPRTAAVTVEANRPLRDDQKAVTFVVRDYWGAEQTKPATVPLTRAGKKGGAIAYEATLDLSAAPLEVGRYYEVHATIPAGEGELFRNHTSLAILPEAPTKKLKPEDVPFTARNWDNRIPEFIRLSDRLGVRVCGVWGTWSATAPYKPDAPGLDLVRELGMGVLTTTPATSVERGESKYTEEALRQGAKNFVEKYGKHRPLVINLGNEPHGTGEKVLRNVAAYQAVYEGVKAADPSVPVVATSVEPNEEYFKAGYGKWCDAYDFHIYESAADVRRTMGEYRALMKKYGVERPIWSTELGLNSQGMTRHVVAAELLKKTATFFAAGGTSMSWFGLLYPDPDGKQAGSSGDSHNVFDCRFNRYAPRLDAVAYYHAVNGVAARKFVAEREYPNGVRAFLFRDAAGTCLQVLWAENGRRDVSVPLPAATAVDVVRIDGTRRSLAAGDTGLTLGLTADPVLLLYAGGAELPAALGEPAASIPAPPKAASRRGPTVLTVAGTAEAELVAPPFWGVAKAVAGGEVRFTLAPPAGTAAREVDLTVTLPGKRGELPVRLPLVE